MSIQSNSEGIQIDLIKDMKIFDLLPDYIQKIIRNQNFDLHVEPIARLYLEMERKGLSSEYISYEIRKRCQQACEE